MEARTTIKEAEESDAEKKKASLESSIFSTILADIEQNPTMVQKQKMLSADFSVFSRIVAVGVEENPKILQKKNNKKLKKSRRTGSMKTPVDFTRTVPQTLTHSDVADILNQELKILTSEMESEGQTSDRFVSPNPNYGDCVKEGKVERHEEVKFLANEGFGWISRGEGDLKSDISTPGEDSVCRPEDVDILENFDEMLSPMLRDENEQVNKAEGGGGIDEFIEKMLAKVENDGTYLERIRNDYVYGDLIEDLLRQKLREKAEKEEKEIPSRISNVEPEVKIRVAEEKKVENRDTKKKSPVKVKWEKTGQESTVTKRDCREYKRRLYLIQILRERDENLMKRRVKALSFGVDFSFFVVEYMFQTPTQLLAREIEDYWICLKRFGVNGDDKGTSVIIGKLEEVFEILIRSISKKESKQHHNVNLPESTFRFDDYILLCVDAIQILGKIVWALRSNQCEQIDIFDVDSLFEDCQRVLMKIELKLAEMKQYRSVSADYESFSKSERFDGLLSTNLNGRFNVDNRFGRSAIDSYLVEIWVSPFHAQALQEPRAEKRRMMISVLSRI